MLCKRQPSACVQTQLWVVALRLPPGFLFWSTGLGSGGKERDVHVDKPERVPLQ